MRYDDAVEAFFPARPAGTPVPAAVTGGSAARQLRDAIEPLATHPIWSRPVNEALAGLGLDFLSAYVWGRAAALGTPSCGAAAAAFAWFEPSLVGGVLTAGQVATGRDALVLVRDRETEASIGQVLVNEDLSGAADLLLRAATSIDPVGRPLFAGLRERPVPTSAAGRLQRAAELLREARGDAHVAVAVTTGLGPVEMNVLTELWLGMELGSYTGTRGWSGEAVTTAVAGLERLGWLAHGDLTPEGFEARDRLEAVTDAAMVPALEVLGADLPALLVRLSGWGEQCVQAGAFPADVLKRAAG